MPVQMRVNYSRAKRFANQYLSGRLKAAAQDVKQEMKAAVGVPFPPASSPGKFPRRRSGRFRASIKYRVDRGRVRIVFFSDDPKAQWLEYGTRFMAPRPTFRIAMRRFKKRLEQRVKRSSKIEIR